MNPWVLVVKYILSFFTFGCLLFLVYVTTRFLGQRTAKNMKSKHMKVVESISLGFDKNIYLLRVDKKGILVSTSGKMVQYLTDVELDHIEDSEEETVQQFDYINVFKKHLNRFIQKNQGTGSSDEQVSARTVNPFDVTTQKSQKDSISNNVNRLKYAMEKLNLNSKGGDENIYD